MSIGAPTFTQKLFEPESPALHSLIVDYVGHIGGNINVVAIQGNYAYVGEGYSLTILDISDSAAPVLAGRSNFFPEIVMGVTVAGDYAFVGDGYSGLRVVDVSNPIDPLEIAFYDTPGYARSVAVAGATPM